MIVVLSEEGQLEACYLGSEPSLFIAPPLHRRGYDYVAAEDELMELRKLAKKNKASGMKKIWIINIPKTIISNTKNKSFIKNFSEVQITYFVHWEKTK